MAIWNHFHKERSEEQRIHDLLVSDDFELM